MLFWLLLGTIIAKLEPYFNAPPARHRAAPAAPAVPPWDEWTPAALAAWEDAEWARAIKRMAERMTPTYQAFA